MGLISRVSSRTYRNKIRIASKKKENKEMPSKMSGTASSHPEVTVSDQKQINKFARTHRLVKEQEEDLKKLKAKMSDLNDDEEDGKVPYLVGDCFLSIDSESAVSNIESAKEILQQKIDDLAKEKDRNLAQVNTLKKELYGKFGTSINLEE